LALSHPKFATNKFNLISILNVCYSFKISFRTSYDCQQTFTHIVVEANSVTVNEAAKRIHTEMLTNPVHHY